jgi:hypothetical protein
MQMQLSAHHKIILLTFFWIGKGKSVILTIQDLITKPPKLMMDFSSSSSISSTMKRSYKQEFLRNQIEDIDNKMETLLASKCRSGNELESMLEMQKNKHKLERELRKLKGTQLRQQRFREKKRKNGGASGSDSGCNSPCSFSPTSSLYSSPVQEHASLSSTSCSAISVSPSTLSTALMSIPSVFTVPASRAAQAQPNCTDISQIITGSEEEFLLFIQGQLPSRASPDLVENYKRLIQRRQQYLADVQEYGLQTAKALFKMTSLVAPIQYTNLA